MVFGSVSRGSLAPSAAERARPSRAQANLAKRADGRLAWWSVGWGLLILLLLQAWRPFFFLTDDNLVGLLPVLSALGRNLLHGQSPFWIGQLFGGWDLLRDPSGLCLWNPFVLALALLTQTPLRFCVVDLFVGAHLLLAAFGCAHLLALWRARFGLGLGDRRLVFLSVSYAFSAFSIIVCASWSSFAPNIAAAPLALLGMFHSRRRTGVLLVAASTLMGILDGHLSPFAWAAVSLTAFALLWPLAARDAPSTCAAEPTDSRAAHAACEVPLRWASGSLLAIGACAPLLWLAMSGFAHTARDSSFALREVVWMKVPALIFVLSWLVGSLSALADAGHPLLLVQLPSGASHAIAAAAGAHFVLLSLLSGRSGGAAGAQGEQGAQGERGLPHWARLDWLFGLLCASVLLLVARPAWLESVIERLPLLRSLRFPFREIWLFHLWTHGWMAWRGARLSPRLARLSALSGALTTVLSLVLWAPPTFSRLNLTRDWVLSGRAQRFWAWMKPRLPPGSRLLPVATQKQWEQFPKLPLPLLCTFNFPALFDVPSPGGYVIKGMERGRVRRGQVGGPAGLRSPAEGKAALSRDPRLILVSVRSLNPLTLRFDGRNFHRIVLPHQIPGL